MNIKQDFSVWAIVTREKKYIVLHTLGKNENGITVRPFFDIYVANGIRRGFKPIELEWPKGFILGDSYQFFFVKNNFKTFKDIYVQTKTSWGK